MITATTTTNTAPIAPNSTEVNNNTKSPSKTSGILIYAVAGGGGAVLLLAVVGLIAFLIIRKKRRPNHQSSDMELTSNNDAPSLASLSDKKPVRYRAVKSYNAVGHNELSLVVGEDVFIMEELTSGWLVGRARGSTGRFPADCVVQSPKPWRAPKDSLKSSDWEEEGYSSTPYSQCLLKKDGQILRKYEWEQLQQLFQESFHGDKWEITTAYAIFSEGLCASFEQHLNALENNRRKSPAKFCSEDWRKSPQADWREWINDILQNYINSFDYNHNLPLPVIPALHGTTDDVALQVCQTGFANITATDSGWFGRGIYFTRYVDYAASTYAKTNSNGEKALLVSFLNVGNAYPVVEHPQSKEKEDFLRSLNGSTCRNGYQSHYTVVQTKAESLKDNYTPAQPSYRGDVYDEIVVFEKVQALPAYLIYVKPKH